MVASVRRRERELVGMNVWVCWLEIEKVKVDMRKYLQQKLLIRTCCTTMAREIVSLTTFKVSSFTLTVTLISQSCKFEAKEPRLSFSS